VSLTFTFGKRDLTYALIEAGDEHQKQGKQNTEVGHHWTLWLLLGFWTEIHWNSPFIVKFMHENVSHVRIANDQHTWTDSAPKFQNRL
jgi:hypothetical protein